MIDWLRRTASVTFHAGLRIWAWMVTILFDRRLPAYYQELAAAGAVGVRTQPIRGADIILQLRRHAPRLIWELGSGSSTGVFASYAAKQNARVVTVEHAAQWREVAMAGLGRTGLATDALQIILSPVRFTDRGVRYAAEIPNEVDFVYVDGPPTEDESGLRHPCIDVLEALDRGARPKVILVDGRDLTFAALREHSVVSSEYEVRVGRRSRYAGPRSWRDRLRFRPHHLFVRRHLGQGGSHSSR